MPVCSYGNLEIFDVDSTTNLNGSVKCSEYAEYFESSGSRVFLRFTSDGSRQYSGFSAMYGESGISSLGLLPDLCLLCCIPSSAGSNISDKLTTVPSFKLQNEGKHETH